LAIKYACDQTKEGAVALFQRYTGYSYPLVPGGHFQPKECGLGPLNPSYSLGKEFLGNLTTFLKGEDVVSKTQDKIFILNLAK